MKEDIIINEGSSAAWRTLAGVDLSAIRADARASGGSCDERAALGAGRYEAGTGVHASGQLVTFG